jgi:hypothetical protein
MVFVFAHSSLPCKVDCDKLLIYWFYVCYADYFTEVIWLLLNKNQCIIVCISLGACVLKFLKLILPSYSIIWMRKGMGNYSLWGYGHCMLFFTGQTGFGFIINGHDHIRSDFKVASQLVLYFFSWLCVGGWWNELVLFLVL